MKKSKGRLWPTWLTLALLSSLFLLLAACGGTGTTQPAVEHLAPGAASIPAWFSGAKKQGFRSHGQYIAAKAIALASALYGPQANQYYADDPSLASVIAYWKQSCQNSDGSLCADARSGSLQCVEFVSAVFAQIDDELPYGGDANQFWKLYQDKSGWQELSAGMLSHAKALPELGDIMDWSGNGVGHLAIVIDQQAPTGSSDGYIVVAQANAASAIERLTWHRNGQIDSWPGYQFLGFIRQQELAPCLQQQVTPTQQAWETLAIEAAVHYGTPSRYFLRQLCQSGFQANNQQRQPLLSSSGAIGIAQLPESVAVHIPRCVINFVANAPNCEQLPGSLPTGTGINPALPEEALPAAAYEMSLLYSHYLHNKAVQVPQDEVAAYSMALAAYNAGTTAVDQAVSTCGKIRWLDCLDSQQKNHITRNYVHVVLG